MATFNSNHVTISYETHGDGQPIVLVHGFASSFKRNWQNPGWVDWLTSNGFRVIGLDVRGHGESEKPYDSALHSSEHTSGDVLRLLAHLDIAQADVMGYSMGAAIALHLTAYHGAHFRKVILGGIGDGAIGSGMVTARPEAIVTALEANDLSTISDTVARNFRLFAERGGNDLKALAAVMRRPRAPLDLAAVQRINRPVLVVVGEKDDIAGGAHNLAQAIPNAQLVTVPDRDHLTVVGDQRYKDAVVKFLREA